MGGGPWPPPMLWFCGPFGPAKRRRPPRNPTATRLPRASARPAALRRLPRGQEGWDDHAGGAAAFGGRGAEGPTACQTKERGPGSLAPGPALSGRFASSRRPPSGRVSSNAKKAREKPGPTIYGAWPMKRCQEGARQRPHPSGKARAHALGARAASSAPPRATTASRQQPLLRDYRRARSTAVGVAPPWA